MFQGPNRDRLTLSGAVVRLLVISTMLHLALLQTASAKPFRIQVVDAATSRGIPMVILETSLSTRHVTDSNGVIAFTEPLAMNRDISFKPISDGYSYQAPSLAMGGVVLKPRHGTSATLVLQRDMIAERLFRITGAGIYHDTMALGEQAPIAEPLINSGVIGQDSTLCAVYGGKLFWVWGDTSRMGHPLSANFRATSAVSDLPGSGSLTVDRGINLSYFKKDDFVKPMVNIGSEERSGVYWLTCLMNVPDENRAERLLAWYNKITMPGMQTVERGIVEFDPKAEEFRKVADYATSAPLQPAGHAARVSAEGDKFQYFTTTDGQFRVSDRFDAASSPVEYEALTCLESDGPFSTSTAIVMRDGNGKVAYKWRKGAAPTGATHQMQLVEAGKLKGDECIFRPVDVATGKTLLPHGCSIAWNGHRNRWVMVTSELMGTSMLGELWYLEADRPEGPWVDAIKVLTHDKYSFYNPLLHPELATADDHYIYFEGTYTKTFSGVEVATPYYDYNQIMYRIDLNDSRLKMPSPDKTNTNITIGTANVR